MSGYTIDTSADRVVVGELDSIWQPASPRKGTCGVILLHGQSNPRGWIDAANAKAALKHAATLADAGIPCISAEMHGNSWATDQSMADMDAAWAVLKAAYPLMRTDKVCLFGISMGGAFVTRYAQLHPDRVAAIVGIIPAYDPRASYVYSNVGDFFMEQAWGFSGLANFPAALNLGANYAPVIGLPLLTGYASNDSAISAASIVAYHNNVQADPANLINVGALDHTDAAIAAVPTSTVTRFFIKHGA